MKTPVFVLNDDVDIKRVKQTKHCYIIAKNGIFFKDTQDKIETLTPVDKINSLSTVKPYMKWKFPKITKEQIAMIVYFFKKIYILQRTECMVLLGWHNIDKKIVVVVPKQVVTPSSIKYEYNNIKDVQLIGSIHSHASMGAFHSGTDKSDEINFDGLHITLGKFNKDNDYFETSSQITHGKLREKIDIFEVVDGIEKNYSAVLKVKNLLTLEKVSLNNAIDADDYEASYSEHLKVDIDSLSDNVIKMIDEKWISKVVEPQKIYRNKEIFHGGLHGYSHQQHSKYPNQSYNNKVTKPNYSNLQQENEFLNPSFKNFTFEEDEDDIIDYNYGFVKEESVEDEDFDLIDGSAKFSNNY